MQEENLEIEIYTLTDEDGAESEYELIGSLDIDGQTYVALVPYEEDENSDENIDYEFIVLRVENEDGEEVFVSIEDEAEFDKAASAFEEALVAETDYDDEDDDESE